MRSVQVREAKAGLSALIEAAERGEATTITRDGKAAAVLVPVEVARKLYAAGGETENFADFLMSFPGGVEMDRDETAMRSNDL